MRAYTPTVGAAVYTSLDVCAQRICAHTPTVADKVQTCWTFKASAYIPGQLATISRVTKLNANVIMADGAVNIDEALVALVEASHCLYVTTRADYKDHDKRQNAWKGIGEKLGKDGTSSMVRYIFKRLVSCCARQPVNDGFKVHEEYLSPNYEKSLFANKGWRKMWRQAFYARLVKSLPFTNYIGLPGWS